MAGSVSGENTHTDMIHSFSWREILRLKEKPLQDERYRTAFPASAPFKTALLMMVIGVYGYFLEVINKVPINPTAVTQAYKVYHDTDSYSMFQSVHFFSMYLLKLNDRTFV